MRLWILRYNSYMPEIASAPQYDVAERSDHVEVRGVTGDDVLEALRLLDAVRGLQATQVSGKRDDLVRALMTSNISLTPPASVAQARRLASHRDALLATPVLTYDTLQLLRGEPKESSTRTWFARRRAEHAVFAVTHNGRTLIPAFQLDQFGQPRPELRPILDVLLQGGVNGWPLWTWLTSPTSLLSGQTPETVARTAPERAMTAATRFAVPPAA
jgi:hypothetical protein